MHCRDVAVLDLRLGPDLDQAGRMLCRAPAMRNSRGFRRGFGMGGPARLSAASQCAKGEPRPLKKAYARWTRVSINAFCLPVRPHPNVLQSEAAVRLAGTVAEPRPLEAELNSLCGEGNCIAYIDNLPR
jgi:hypothetical protein